MSSAVVLGGKTGLLGQALSGLLAARGWMVHAPGRDDLDIFDREAVADYVRAAGADVLFNTVAHTRVNQDCMRLVDCNYNTCFREKPWEWKGPN